ncbi:mCG148250 [Mus musculus]|nr:mCG148250 [Mus musculus]
MHSIIDLTHYIVNHLNILHLVHFTTRLQILKIKVWFKAQSVTLTCVCFWPRV